MSRAVASCKTDRRTTGAGSGLALAALLVVAPSLRAQGLPPLTPINPATESRGGLYFQPYEDPAPGWRKAVTLEYSSMMELNLRPDTGYLLDAEVLRLRLAVRRDVGVREYLSAELTLGGAYDGFLDGFLNWYHGLLGIRFPEREGRPDNRYDYAIAPSDELTFRGGKRALFLEDLRLGVGRRHDRRFQSHLSLTLPTSTGPAGFGRGTIAIALLHTYRAPLDSAVTFEGSLGTGYTPKHGPLARYQRTVFLSATSGARIRLWGGQSVYVNLFFHTPYYRDTRLRSLDGRDLTINFGALFRRRDGSEWRLGMSEDLFPSGPGVDLVLQVGRSF